MATWISLLLIAAVAGIIGGIINYIIEIPPKKGEEYEFIGLLFLKWILLSFGAAAAVPAFLAFTESVWLDEIFNDNPEKYLVVYSGISIVVAIFPTAFLAGMSNRINAKENENKKLKEEIKGLRP